MGCFSHRRQGIEVRPEQKWDYISLKDFKSTSCFTPLAYGYLFLALIISLAVYTVDTFTAVSLLAFNKWASEIQPAVPFDVSKWIFSACIIASFVNLAFEHIRAIRVMKRGSVAECYLDNLAVRMESVRLGKGQGWRRFLVFAELTKSKKGAEYVALFSYFAFQSWIRVIFCSGPRQVVNALTLYSVYTSKLTASGDNVGDTIMSFFDKIKILATQNSQQSLILSGMLFTLIIWVFSVLSLLLAVLFYVFFLWHYIPRADGGLGGYLERKINTRLTRIVTSKVNKAIEKQEQVRLRAEARAAKKAGEKPPMERQATLPTLMSPAADDSLPQMPTLSRNDTMTTLPPYTSRPGTPSSIELGAYDQKRPFHSRTTTMSSQASVSSRAPLMGNAGDNGFGRSASPAPSVPKLDLNNFPPARTGTANSIAGYGPRAPANRMPSNGTFGAPYTASPAPLASETVPIMPAPAGGRPPPPGWSSFDPYAATGRSSPAPRSTYDDYSSNGRASPAPSMYSNRGGPASPRGPMPPAGPGYAMRSATGPVPPRMQQYTPQRNMTGPLPPRPSQGPPNDDYDSFTRPGISSNQRSMSRPQNGGYGYDVESQRGPYGPPRY